MEWRKPEFIEYDIDDVEEIIDDQAIENEAVQPAFIFCPKGTTFIGSWCWGTTSF